jgi:NTE family protein
VSRIPLVAPDVLVLAGGGTLGEAWMTGLLAGIEDSSGLDLRGTESFVGTSAGSIVAARLAAGVALRRPRSIAPAVEADRRVGDHEAVAEAHAELPVSVDRAADPGALDWLERAAAPVLAPIIGPALRLERLPAEIIRGAVLSLLPDGTRSLAELEQAIERDQSRFDGRLRIVVVDRRSGRRVVFGAPGAPDASVAQAVAASCAIPGVFRAVEIAGRDYVDGGVWSLTNLDAAPAGRRTELLCLNPMRDLPTSLFSRLGLVSRVVRGREALELALVRGRGTRVRVIGPAPHAGLLMAPDLMDPGPREAVLHAGYAQGLELGQAD